MENLTHIFGCPRSGSTWLWSLLTEHPDIVPITSKPPINGVYSTSESGIYINEVNPVKKIINICRNNKHVLEKTPSHTKIYEKINNIFPRSKNILLLRNPESIFESYLKSNVPGLPKNKLEIYKEIKLYFKIYQEIEKNSFVITYYDLKKDTQNVLNSIFHYLGLKYYYYENLMVHKKVNVPHVFRRGEHVPECTYGFDFSNEIEFVNKHKNN